MIHFIFYVSSFNFIIQTSQSDGPNIYSFFCKSSDSQELLLVLCSVIISDSAQGVIYSAGDQK